MLRMLEAARLTGATDMRRDAAAIAISSCSTAVTAAPHHRYYTPHRGKTVARLFILFRLFNSIAGTEPMK